ncbi:myosin regulatory light chain 2-like [Thrips palmi]|uniref:Myosin regulatory light chain 2-like n=1 Tax=Thrips palmi TaxID=161013 RepID=A0A6P8YC75_THRPL|nr:myosin regulatory light chain 2-like [Thrips palmi]
MSKKSGSTKKKAKRSASNVFSAFPESEIAAFKQGFQMMDYDKDGVLGKEDLRQTFDWVGRPTSDKELNEMLSEADGPINLVNLLGMFAAHMSGDAYDDQTVKNAVSGFDKNGKVDLELLRKRLTTEGDDPFSNDDLDTVFEALGVDDEGLVNTNVLIEALSSGAGSGEEAK